MRRLVFAAFGAAVICAGHSEAATTIIDVSESSALLSTSYDNTNTEVSGDVRTPSFDLAPGDTLEVNIALLPVIALTRPVIPVDFNPIVSWMPGEMVITSFTSLGPALGLTGVRLKFSNPAGGSTADLGGSFFVDFAPAPEPATWALMLTGVSLLGARLRRRGDRRRHRDSRRPATAGNRRAA